MLSGIDSSRALKKKKHLQHHLPKRPNYSMAQ